METRLRLWKETSNWTLSAIYNTLSLPSSYFTFERWKGTGFFHPLRFLAHHSPRYSSLPFFLPSVINKYLLFFPIPFPPPSSFFFFFNNSQFKSVAFQINLFFNRGFKSEGTMHSPGNNSPFNYEWRGNTARVLFKIKRATEGGRGNEKKKEERKK